MNGTSQFGECCHVMVLEAPNEDVESHIQWRQDACLNQIRIGYLQFFFFWFEWVADSPIPGCDKALGGLAASGALELLKPVSGLPRPCQNGKEGEHILATFPRDGQSFSCRRQKGDRTWKSIPTQTARATRRGDSPEGRRVSIPARGETER